MILEKIYNEAYLEKKEDIFKRYHRATKEQGGFGIGLNIVQNICLSYDIKFDVKSKIKKGTTFTFIFIF